MADVPHLIKNLNAALVNRHIIRHDNRIVSIRPVEALAQFQEHCELKLAPNLKLSSLNKPKHFAKMKVANALHIISNSVAKGLLYMVEMDEMPSDLVKEAKDTAWFLSLMNSWFDIMSSRSPVMALSLKNQSRYEEAIEVLNTVIYVVKNMRIGDGQWKPVQTGILLSTHSVISLSQHLLGEHGIHFLLTARFTQDCLENLFSSVRIKNATPTPVEFKKALKIITVAQFLKTAKHGSYDTDDSTYLADYLEQVKLDIDETGSSINEIIVTTENASCILDLHERNSLYYIAGIVHLTCHAISFQYYQI